VGPCLDASTRLSLEFPIAKVGFERPNSEDAG
jgi:hypothetical protein